MAEDLGRYRLAEAVKAERLKHGWTKQKAGEFARISPITWKRVEDGLRVQDLKLRAIEEAFGWGYGSASRIMRGREAIIEPDPAQTSKTRNFQGLDSDLIESFQAASLFARRCEERGADSGLVADFIRDAVVLLDAVARAQQQPEALAARRGTPEVEHDEDG